MTRPRARVVQVAFQAFRTMLWDPRGRQRRPEPFRARPLLEALEDRQAPAVFGPTSFADGTTPNTLRGAIIAANGNGQDDVIDLQAGVYKLTLAGRRENACATGDLDV